MPRLLLFCLTFLILFPCPLLPAEGNNLFRTLSLTRSLKCTFTTVMQGDWEGGSLSTSKEIDQSFVLHFDGIEIAKLKARLIGNLGSEDVVVMLTASSLTFVEMTPAGNPNFTTVFPAYKKGTKEFIAVTSRHLLVIDRPFPSQRHGSCQVWE
jgi:hypothetical protein